MNAWLFGIGLVCCTLLGASRTRADWELGCTFVQVLIVLGWFIICSGWLLLAWFVMKGPTP